jgi:RNA polymerase sigma-70 factor (ECF subfamily)
VPELLKKMNEKHLTLLQKYYFQGYTHSEIVEELGIPLGTIKTRLRNAIQELRRILPHDLHIHQTC